MLEYLVLASIRARRVVLMLLVLVLALGAVAAARLPIDAMPDVTTVQVSVLTSAPGAAPVEVERSVTTPIENALNGVPGRVELRSVSRSGLSVVTVVFADGTNPWFARQLVGERLRGIELPPGTSSPELAPLSSGLGEIFQFVVRSEQHSPMQLRTLLDWDVVPKLREVAGVIEVNSMGGELKQFQVVVDHARLRAHALTLSDVVGALRSANMNVGGGYVERHQESFTVRGLGLLTGTTDVASVVVRAGSEGPPILVRDVAEVRIAPALRYGLVTHGGSAEAVTGIVMMLVGANSREVVNAVGERVRQIQADLPPGVQLDVVYDRADFVGRTLTTVGKNLAEGVLVVLLVLIVFLGSLRAGLAVVLGVPVAMSIALFGMHAFGVTGDLMSLGAIDFGFLVDGPIVIVESVIAVTASRQLVGAQLEREYGAVAVRVARPVAFAVAILLLVYVPLFALEGVEGKMFRPMALTMACALFGALVYAVVFFPAVLVTFVPPATSHGPRWLGALNRQFTRALPTLLGLRWVTLTGALVGLVATGYAFSRAGAEFVPRIFEGDAVVTIRRAPSIALGRALELDLQTQRVLSGFPEVTSTLGMTGRAEVATDPVGNDNTDVLVRLAPPERWSSARDFDELSELFKTAVEREVPSTFVSVSQPIEDRTNEIISGSRADVQIQLRGPELSDLSDLARDVGRIVRGIPGTGDVRIERVLGAPTISAQADRARLARYGTKVEDAFTVLQAAREGVPVGEIFEQHRRFDLRVVQPPREPTAEALGDLFVETGHGDSVPLREVVTLTEGDGPTAVRHENRERAVRVDVNLRGRDLVSWVAEAQGAVTKQVALPAGYEIGWGGQFENFERARKRLGLVVPAAVGIIVAMLLWMFGNWRFALAVFALVPLALTGGLLGLLARGLPFSLPAAVGLIALAGIGVLNGVVVASEVRDRLHAGEPLDAAISGGASHTLRAVLATATVAALGFLPMALATGAGAEVQRPLATTVIVGMLAGTLLTLAVLPGVLRILLAGYVVPRTAMAPEELPAALTGPRPLYTGPV